MPSAIPQPTDPPAGASRTTDGIPTVIRLLLPFGEILVLLSGCTAATSAPVGFDSTPIPSSRTSEEDGFAAAFEAQASAIETRTDCPDFMDSRMELALNALHQVIVTWELRGGCPPFLGTISAWYQDEDSPTGTLGFFERSGEWLETPILHFGSWDRDYYLDVADTAGHRLHMLATIGVGR